MIKTWLIFFAVSGFVVLTFMVAMRSRLRENREIDKKIDYSKLRPLQDDAEEDDK